MSKHSFTERAAVLPPLSQLALLVSEAGLLTSDEASMSGARLAGYGLDRQSRNRQERTLALPPHWLSAPRRGVYCQPPSAVRTLAQWLSTSSLLRCYIGGRCHTSRIPFHTQDGNCDLQLPVWQLLSVVWILGQAFFCIPCLYFPKLFQIQWIKHWESNVKELHLFRWDALCQLQDPICLLSGSMDI